MKKPYVIGLTGGSGSGKTTFIDEMRRRLSEEVLCVFSLDNYYLKREEQSTDTQGVKNFDLLTSFDMDRFIQDLESLIQGDTIQIEEYTFNNALRTARTLTFHPAPVILVEGIFLFAHPDVRSRLDMMVYVHVNDIKKVIRRIKRDGIERNYPIDDVLYRYEHHVLPSYRQYIEPYFDESDIIINNNDNMEQALFLFEHFIKSYAI